MIAHHRAVVVGYDFSHSGHAALTRGVAIAAGAPQHVLHVVCVVDPRAPIPSIPSYRGVDVMYAARIQEALATSVHAELERHEVHARIDFFVHARIGKPVPEILALSREVGADLIIVGSHGLTGLERLVIGSVSEKIVREAGCTVEVARPKRYPDIELPELPETPDEHRYLPPHRYQYEDHRVLLRPNDWPLW
ncbi:MAG: universal stress protein [Kofleriaceae bacterium]|nr:universal stress protein [Kofleriaceae bacterium]